MSMAFLIRFCLCGTLGVVGALLTSSVKRSLAGRRLELTGEASLALFPAWGLIALLYPPIAIHLPTLPWYWRGCIFMGIFYLLQLLIGLGLTRLGLCPWHFSGKDALAGVVRLSDAPIWFLAGLAVEAFYPWVRAVSLMLA
jgi:hypothetical protein